MNYQKFCSILNKHIFESEKIDLLRKIADRPERFIGLFRPTKPYAKVLQHLLQSNEIKFGDAFEEIIEVILKDLGCENLPKSISTEQGDDLSLDQYFSNDNKYCFIEQKVRDDHDSTKKRGQVNNFEEKLETLYEKYGSKITGIMYFIDPDLVKNRGYYTTKLQGFKKFYNVDLYLFYGKELFDYLNKPTIWDSILSWLGQWRNGLPDLPDINFDNEPEKSFIDIKELELRHWRKLLQNDRLWESGIMQVIFRNGETLKLMLTHFSSRSEAPYKKLAELLGQRLAKHYAY